MPNATFCVFCGGALAETPARPLPLHRWFPVAKTMTRFDWLVTGLLAAVLVAGSLFSPGGWESYALWLLLPAYVVLEAVRTRRPWLAGGLGAGVTALFLMAGGTAHAYGLGAEAAENLFSENWWSGGIPWGTMGRALPGVGGLGLLTGWIAARLAQPMPWNFLERPLGALMVPGAVADLGLQQLVASEAGGEGGTVASAWSPAPLGGQAGQGAPPSGGWLDSRQRRQAVDRLLAALARLNLPRVGVTSEEVWRGQAVRTTPREGCEVCGGAGTIACPQCRDAVGGICERCRGRGTVFCDCVDTVTYTIPRGAPSGYIIRGVCNVPAHRHYATVHANSLPRRRMPLLLTLVGVLGVPAGALLAIISARVAFGGSDAAAIEVRIGCLLLTLGGALWALIAVPVLARARRGWAWMQVALGLLIVGGAIVLIASPLGVAGILRGGLAFGLLLADLALLAALAGLAMLLGWWYSPVVTAQFPGRAGSDRDDLVRTAAPALLPARDRLSQAASSRGLRALGWVFAVAVVGWVLLDALAGSRWALARANLSAAMGGGQQAIALYDEAAGRARSEGQRRQAVRGGNRERIRQLEDAVAEKEDGAWGSERAAAVASVCRSLADHRRDLDGQQQGRVPELMLACGDALAEHERWEEAREVLDGLVSDFGDSAPAGKATDRSVWQFVAVKKVDTPAEMLDNPYPVVTGMSVEWQHGRLRPAGGHRLVLITMELAHLGSTKKELLASRFTLTDRGGKVFPAVALPDVDQSQSDELHVLRPSREYPGVSVGPDVCEAEAVFEVPEGVPQFNLALKGEGVARIKVPD